MPVDPSSTSSRRWRAAALRSSWGSARGAIALPLAQRGVRVRGIDLSPDMVAKLREKPGAESIDVTIGDFATTRVEGSFSLAYVVFNTIVNLTTQERRSPASRTWPRTSSRAGASSSRSASAAAGRSRSST